jgi:tetratricopeptide (TPR) repeat protein
MQRIRSLFIAPALVFAATVSCIFSYPAPAATLAGSGLPCLGEDLASDQTILACTVALRRNPKDAKVLIRRGIAWIDMGDYDFAIGDFSRAIRLSPQSALAYFNRGVAREKKGELEKSLVDFKRYGELNPSDPEAQKAVERVTAALALKLPPRNLSDYFAEHPINLAGLESDRPTGPSGAVLKSSDCANEDFFLFIPTLFLIASAGVVAIVARRKANV